MSDSSRCPQCGAELRAGAPCPACLMQLGLQTSADRADGESGQDAAATEATNGRFQPPSPEELAGHFPQLEILELLGAGGMGAVYKARQPGLDRLVALKILPPGVGRDPAFTERFAREARAMAKLSHPNIVTIHDFGETDGVFFLVMEYVDGVNLRQLLRSGRMSPREALAIVPQICDALQYAHDQGIVHRDIKPENVLLDRLGRLKVADFGLAKLVGTVAEPPVAEHPACGEFSLTEAGQVMGTPQYMAPEQQASPADVDHRADIYSLGVVFYQLLTGELPTSRIEPPSKKVHIDVRLDQIVLRALEKEPERRYQQISDVKGDVETIASTLAQKPPGRRPHLFRTKAAVILVGCLVLLGAVLSLRLVHVGLQTRGWRTAHSADRTERAARVLQEWGPRLRSGTPEQRTEAALHIHDQGPWARPAVHQLIQALSDEHYLVRMLCAETLGFVGEQAGPEALEALHRALSDSDQRVRVCAAVALSKADLKTTANLPVLIDTLTDRPPDDIATTVWPVRRREAAEALGRMGKRAERALPALRARLGERGVSEAIEEIEKGK